MTANYNHVTMKDVSFLLSAGLSTKEISQEISVSQVVVSVIKKDMRNKYFKIKEEGSPEAMRFL